MATFSASKTEVNSEFRDTFEDILVLLNVIVLAVKWVDEVLANGSIEIIFTMSPNIYHTPIFKYKIHTSSAANIFSWFSDISHNCKTVSPIHELVTVLLVDSGNIYTYIYIFGNEYLNMSLMCHDFYFMLLLVLCPTFTYIHYVNLCILFSFTYLLLQSFS